MTTEEKNKDTKRKIIEVADKLFAQNGFSGTSVREIAKQAQVNLAAINYHFTNKENLYWSVFDYNYDLLDLGIHKIGEKNLTTSELACEVFQFYISNGSAIMNIFKIFLSDNVAMPKEGIKQDKGEKMGPPGENVFIKAIKHDLSNDVSDEGVKWATKMIISQLVHLAVVFSTGIMKQRCKEQYELGPEVLAGSIAHSVNAHLLYLKENPQLIQFPHK
jgi:hypothetical protein